MGLAVCPSSTTVTVAAGDEQGQITQDFSIAAREIVCAFIEGTVTCATTDDTPVSGALVRVTGGGLNEPLFGITDDVGFYVVCVPVPDAGSASYTVTVLCCPADCCEDAACTCNCAGCPGGSGPS